MSAMNLVPRVLVRRTFTGSLSAFTPLHSVPRVSVAPAFARVSFALPQCLGVARMSSSDSAPAHENPAARYHLYHNPRCSKSRAAVQLLEEQKVDFCSIEYIKTRPSRETLRDVFDMLSKTNGWDETETASNFSRATMPKAKKKDADTNNEVDEQCSTTDVDTDAPPVLSPAEEVLTMVATDPTLLQRPILVDTKLRKAVIGRPPDKVREFLSTEDE